jgi:hypothetical protein
MASATWIVVGPRSPRASARAAHRARGVADEFPEVYAQLERHHVIEARILTEFDRIAGVLQVQLTTTGPIALSRRQASLRLVRPERCR